MSHPSWLHRLYTPREAMETSQTMTTGVKTKASFCVPNPWMKKRTKRTAMLMPRRLSVDPVHCRMPATALETEMAGVRI